MTSDKLKAARKQLEELALYSPIVHAGLMHYKTTHCSYEEALIMMVVGLDKLNKIWQEREVEKMGLTAPNELKLTE